MTNLSLITYKFIRILDDEYDSAVRLRIAAFFEGMKNSIELIKDQHEKNAFHLVCIKNGNVIGIGRLHKEKDCGIISQMAIDIDYQEKGIGTQILKCLIQKCTELNLNEVQLSARKTAVSFYQKFGFKVVGPFYPSTKTRIIHQNMKMVLNKNAK